MPPDLPQLLAGRRSVRAFTGAPVGRAQVERLCRAARSAPSGANLQPGRFHALTGAALTALIARLAEAQSDNAPFDREYSYFPDPMPPEMKDRQRRAGYALYAALGIDRRDLAGRRAQFARNYAFFDAPVGIVVTIDRHMGKGCFMDLGMSLMAFMLAARHEGLSTSGIGALANYGSIVHRHLGLPDDEMVVCGIALGHADDAAPANRVRTERMALDEFTSFRGFGAD